MEHINDARTRCNPTWMMLRRKAYEHRGLLTALAASFAFAAQSICVKLLKGKLPVVELVCLRFLLQGILSLLVGLFSGTPFPPGSRRETTLLLGRGVAGTVAIGLIYFAMFNMSVGMVNTIVFGAPVFIGILAWIFLKEPFQFRDIILVVINLSGIVLIAQPPFLFKSQRMDASKRMELIAVGAALLAMILSASTSIIVRLLGLMKTGAVKIVFYYSVCGTIIPVFAAIFMRDWVIPPCGGVRYLILLIGVFNFAAQALISYGLACTKKSYFVSVINSNQVPVTIILEIIIFREIPDWVSLLGAGLVVGSALGVVFREGTLIRSQKEDTGIELDCDRVNGERKSSVTTEDDGCREQ